MTDTERAAYKISKHAIERFMERSGCKVEDRARKAIKRMLDLAEPVELKPQYRIDYYFKYRFREATYLQRGSWIFVIVAGSVVTCFQAETKRWRKTQSQSTE